MATGSTPLARRPSADPAASARREEERVLFQAAAHRLRRQPAARRSRRGRPARPESRWRPAEQRLQRRADGQLVRRGPGPRPRPAAAGARSRVWWLTPAVAGTRVGRRRAAARAASAAPARGRRGRCPGPPSPVAVAGVGAEDSRAGPGDRRVPAEPAAAASRAPATLIASCSPPYAGAGGDVPAEQSADRAAPPRRAKAIPAARPLESARSRPSGRAPPAPRPMPPAPGVRAAGSPVPRPRAAPPRSICSPVRSTGSTGCCSEV